MLKKFLAIALLVLVLGSSAKSTPPTEIDQKQMDALAVVNTWVNQVYTALCQKYGYDFSDKAMYVHFMDLLEPVIGYTTFYWTPEKSGYEILIDVDLKPSEVPAVVLHEIIHAKVGCSHGHDEVFQAEAIRVGFEAPFVETRPNKKLRVELDTLLIKCQL